MEPEFPSRSGNSEPLGPQDPLPGEPKPIIAVRPQRQVAGELIEVTGSGFGAEPATRTVMFSSIEVTPTGGPEDLRAQVPNPGDKNPVSAPVRLRVRYENTGTEELSTPRPFTILPRETPELTPIQGPVFAGDKITLRGRHLGPGPGFAFGRAPYALLFDDVAVSVADESWSPEQIEAIIPSFATSEKRVMVRVATPWGTSAARELVVFEPPDIAEARVSGIPDSELKLTGVGFGSVEGEVVFEGDDVDPVRADVIRWRDTEIQARVPGVGRLTPSAHRRIRVTARGRSATVSFAYVNRRSITTWNRLEPHARIEDLQEGLRRGLEARVYDPAWLLARQWQLGEFRGEDAGSPVTVQVVGETAPLVRWRPRAGAVEDLPRQLPLPLEPLVEREASTVEPAEGWSLRLAVESGLHFFRLLMGCVKNAQRLANYRKRYLELYALEPPPASRTLDAESRRFAGVATGRALDGRKLYVALRGVLASGTLLPDPELHEEDEMLVKGAILAWYEWVDALSPPVSPQQESWDPERLEYVFAVSAEPTEGEVVLTASEHTGKRVDWHSFGVDPDATLRHGDGSPQVKNLECTAVPTPASFRGMPAARWWEFEAADFDFGRVSAGPADLARLVLIEFASLLGSDWFVVPLGGVPVGSLVALKRVTVTNSFGETSDPLIPLSSREDGRWRMFELSVPSGKPPDMSSVLFLPSTLTTTVEGAPLEDVILLRDEMTNMVWGVERFVENDAGRSLDRFEAEQAQRAAESGDTPTAGTALAYRLLDEPLRNWIPFGRLDGAQPRLRRRGRVEPLGKLLAGDAQLYEEEVPREGTRVARAYRYARGTDGSTYLWVGRRKQPGGREGSSGLRFDIVAPAE